MLLIQLLYAIACVNLAYVNFRLIDSGRRVYHALNGLLHLTAAVIVGICVHPLGAICILLVARLVFDIALNRFRGLPMNYVPAKPKSIVDRIERWVFGRDGYEPKLWYLTALFILNIAIHGTYIG